jgi:hypothetical protein
VTYVTPAEIAEGPPTKRQLWYIRLLSSRKGTTYPEPKTFAAANRLIHDLRYASLSPNQFLG